MDRRLAWFLFILCFGVSIWGTEEIFTILETRTSSAMSDHSGVRPGDRGILVPGEDELSHELWFESHSHELEAENRMKNAKIPEALSELDLAIDSMERIKKEQPEFRPVNVDFRLAKLKELRDSWEGTATSESPSGPGEEWETNAPRVIARAAVPIPALSIERNLRLKSEVPVNRSRLQVPVLADGAMIEFSKNDGLEVEVPAIGSEALPVRDSPGLITLNRDDPAFVGLRKEKIPGNGNISRTLSNDILGRFLPDGLFPSKPVEKPLKRGSGDSSSIWYRAYINARSAKELEAEGEVELAREKYEASKKLYEVLNREYPEVESDHIPRGLRRIEDKLEALNTGDEHSPN